MKVFESLTKTDMIDAYWHVNVRTYNVWRWFMRRKIAGKAFFWSQECFQKPSKTILYPEYIGKYLACLHSNKIFLVLNISNSFFSETSLRNLCKNLIIESCSCKYVFKNKVWVGELVGVEITRNLWSKKKISSTRKMQQMGFFKGNIFLKCWKFWVDRAVFKTSFFINLTGKKFFFSFHKY